MLHLSRFFSVATLGLVSVFAFVAPGCATSVGGSTSMHQSSAPVAPGQVKSSVSSSSQKVFPFRSAEATAKRFAVRYVESLRAYNKEMVGMSWQEFGQPYIAKTPDDRASHCRSFVEMKFLQLFERDQDALDLALKAEKDPKARDALIDYIDLFADGWAEELWPDGFFVNKINERIKVFEKENKVQLTGQKREMVMNGIMGYIGTSSGRGGFLARQIRAALGQGSEKKSMREQREYFIGTIDRTIKEAHDYVHTSHFIF